MLEDNETVDIEMQDTAAPDASKMDIVEMEDIAARDASKLDNVELQDTATPDASKIENVKMLDALVADGGRKRIVDVTKLLGLLKISKEAGDLIAGKHVVLLIGLTGAGKTTTTLYLAGAEFEEKDVDGYFHYDPKEPLKPGLEHFAVSGSASSVTKNIHATEIDLVLDNGTKEIITICDTPGFGDTKGPEMEISNGLGIIHALKRAASIKPVLVLDQSTMHAARWQPLRKNLSTIIAMMGRDVIDFSSFAYIFTRCEGRSRSRVQRQITGFQNTLRGNPADILGGNTEDFDILDALLTDMIPKTAPDKIICIDPLDAQTAQETVQIVWAGGRIENPDKVFVNFCSKESMSVLQQEVTMMLEDVDSSLESGDLNRAEITMGQMHNLSNTLSLPGVTQTVDKGREKVKQFVDRAIAEVQTLATELSSRVLAMSDFKRTVQGLLQKLQALADTAQIQSICGLPFDLEEFRKSMAKSLFAAVRKTVVDAEGQQDADVCELVKEVFGRHSRLVRGFQALIGAELTDAESSLMVDAVYSLVTPILDRVRDKVLPNLTNAALEGCLGDIGVLFKLKAIMDPAQTSVSWIESPRWPRFKNDLAEVLAAMDERSQACADQLNEVRAALKELLASQEQWTATSPLHLTESPKYIESRAFLAHLSTSELLSKSLCTGTGGPLSQPAPAVRAFDEFVSKYFSALSKFVPDRTQKLFDNSSADLDGRGKEATELLALSEAVCTASATLRDCNSVVLQEAEKQLFGAKQKLQLFMEESKKTNGHGIKRPKPLEPTKEELARATTAAAKKGLASWYSKCRELRAYRLQNGHCNVPQKFGALGKWVMTQRAEKKKYELGLKTAMTDEKLQHLANLDFEWQLPKGLQIAAPGQRAAWDRNIAQLLKFKEEHGHLRVPQKTPTIGPFVMNHRSMYRLHQNGETHSGNNRIHPGRMAQLKEIGLFDDMTK